MIRTKIALAAALLMGMATVALAGDGLRAKPIKRQSAANQSAPMRVNQDSNMATPSNFMMNVLDRASSPFACGG